MLRRSKFIIAALSLAFCLTGGSYVFYLVETGNFHPVTSGEAYRSAQLDKDKLEYYIKKYNLKTILNLRGRSIDEKWYKEEISVSEKYQVMHYDIALSSSNEPTRKDVQELIEIFKSAPRPILIHCRAGADRSGLVSAMWKVIVDGESKSAAGKQLTSWYGHIPIRGTYAMDRFFEKWNPAGQYSY